MGPIKDMKVLLNAFFQEPSLFARSEMFVLVTTSNVCNSEGNEECPRIVALVHCRDTHDFDLYF